MRQYEYHSTLNISSHLSTLMNVYIKGTSIPGVHATFG